MWPAAATFFAAVMVASTASALTPEELTARTAHRRAVDAVIWGQPIVSFDAMRQAYFRDAKARYNDVIWWPNGAGWKNQSLTVNTSVRYIYFFFNTKNDGPVVLELPGEVDGASFFGTITDAWFVPLVDIGSDGADKGKGGKYLVLPPAYKDEVPAGYIPVRPNTYNTYTLVRSILKSNSEEDVRKGNGLVKQIKLYPLIPKLANPDSCWCAPPEHPLQKRTVVQWDIGAVLQRRRCAEESISPQAGISRAANPPEQRFVDMTDILYEGLAPYDASFYTSLARMLNEEPVQPRDLEMMGMLLPLGIEKGKDFKPDAALTAALNSAAQEAHAWLVDGLARSSTDRFWPDRKWVIPTPPIGVTTLFKWEVPHFFDVDARGIALASFFGPTASLGKGSFYLGTFVDASGQPLQGENTYRLRVSANAPVREFWALTVYDKETAALFRESTRLTVGSLDKDLRKNADGSVDLYIGPKAPAGEEANWLYTPAGKGWWPWFRLYGPEQVFFDKTWKLPDIERVTSQ
jgi:hypothetical protein